MIKKNKTFRPRNHINYTERGVAISNVKYRNTIMESIYNLTIVDKSLVSLYIAETGLIYDKELESLKKSLKRLTKKIGTYEVFITAYNAYTSKPAEVRMGKGKGRQEGMLARVAKGQCVCNISNMPIHVATEILKAVSCKLALKTVIRSHIF
jgi:large subunit ribosomal protein L16